MAMQGLSWPAARRHLPSSHDQRSLSLLLLAYGGGVAVRALSPLPLTSRSFFGLLSLFFRLLFSQLLGLFFFLKLTCTLLDLELRRSCECFSISI